MQWGLFLLILVGQRSLLTCEPIEYQFVDEEISWNDAREHCRESYTDLATVYDNTTLNRLVRTIKNQDAWIGLHNDTKVGPWEWQWSKPGLKYNGSEMKWNPEEPNNSKGSENCVSIAMGEKYQGVDDPCSESYRPICYDENTSSEKYHVIATKMSWAEAQRYCREHHTDLLSGHDQMQEFKNEHKFMWIGLFRDTWTWSDGSTSRISFRNWDTQTYSNHQGDNALINKCAAVSGSGKWSPADCNAAKPFFCHEVFLQQCLGRTCEVTEYYFINESKTWEESRDHCRLYNTDLATVSNMRILNSLVRNVLNQDAWIGLYNTGGLREWHWSLPGVESVTITWNTGEPDDQLGTENCVMMGGDGQSGGADITCSESYRPICYDDQTPNEKYHVIATKMNWAEAQRYCREHHTDLLSGHDQMQEFKDEHKFMWIGLFRDTWTWSDGSGHIFRNWGPQAFPDNQGSKCAAVSHESGKWSSADCHDVKPFFCYADRIVLIKKNKTWPEALEYCRAHHNDLVSISDASEQRWVQERAKAASSPHVWLGLRFTCTLSFWFWVSDMAVNYDNWDSGVKTDECDMSGAMDRGGQHKWVKKLDNETFNFICSES